MKNNKVINLLREILEGTAGDDSKELKNILYNFGNITHDQLNKMEHLTAIEQFGGTRETGEYTQIEDKHIKGLISEGLSEAFYSTLVNIALSGDRARIESKGIERVVQEITEERMSKFLTELRADHGRLRVPMRGKMELTNKGMYSSFSDLNYSDQMGIAEITWNGEVVNMDMNRMMIDYLRNSICEKEDLYITDSKLILQPINPLHPFHSPLEFVNRTKLDKPKRWVKEGAGQQQSIVRPEFQKCLDDIIEEVRNATGVELNQKLDVVGVSTAESHLQFDQGYNPNAVMYLAYAHPIIKAIRHIILGGDSGGNTVEFRGVGNYLLEEGVDRVVKMFERLNGNILIDNRLQVVELLTIENIGEVESLSEVDMNSIEDEEGWDTNVTKESDDTVQYMEGRPLD